MYKSPVLDTIRQKIDRLDNQVHDLLMERADLIMAISEEKKRQGIQIVQPGREARMIRRLMARHRGPLPQETIAHIWRELVSSVSLLQTGLSVAVYFTGDDPDYWDMARDYFGSVLPMTRTASVDEAVQLAKSGQVTFAIVPFPDTPSAAQWVPHCISSDQDKKLTVIQCLPFGQRQESPTAKKAAIISLASFGPSDDDHSLLCLDVTDPAHCDFEHIEQHVKRHNLELTSTVVISGTTYVLVDVAAYLEPNSPTIAALAREMGCAVTAIGGYPSGIIYKGYNENITPA